MVEGNKRMRNENVIFAPACLMALSNISFSHLSVFSEFSFRLKMLKELWKFHLATKEGKKMFFSSFLAHNIVINSSPFNSLCQTLI